MLPTALPPSAALADLQALPPRCLVDRDFVVPPLDVTASSGHTLTLSTGETIFDATCGAAVACIGHGNQEVKDAIIAQLDINSYCNSMLFSSPVCEALAQEVIAGTGNLMGRVWFCSSGSEATEGALKLARQYFVEKGEGRRSRVIAREHSYHGNTLGALSVSGHVSRRAMYLPILATNTSWIPACNAYRQRLPNESDAAFVARKAQELDDEFRRVGPETVMAFIAEPVSGVALGCVPYVPGYLAAMKGVCRKYGALVIWDEVMCGMGRSGTLHAWQDEHHEPGTTGVDDMGVDALPDLQMVAKGLGGGYAAIAGVLVGKDVVEVLAKGEKGKGCWAHGQTYQSLPLSCAAALAVQTIVRRDQLVQNCAAMGLLLEKLLKERLGHHPHVGDIRGKGLFWALELVRHGESKAGFEQSWDVAGRIKDMALDGGMAVYHGQGTVDGVRGDHVLVAPAYDVTAGEVEMIVERLGRAVDGVFEVLEKEGKLGA